MTLDRGSSADARYFYLSYAPIPSPDDRLLGDHWVRRFFVDLNAAIDEQPGRRIRRPGFADFVVPPSEDRQAQRQRALTEADVLVPLYTPEYLNRHESRRERDWFRQRVVRAGRAPDGANILPVLWTPSPLRAHRAEQERALLIARDVEAYADSGLSALCRLLIYQGEYQKIVRRMARHIVETAASSPLQVSSPSAQPAVTPPPPVDIPFRTVLITPDWAPTAGDVALANGYESLRSQWRPFPGQPPVVADIVLAVERLRMPARVHDFVPAGDLFEHCPGIIVIDTRVLGTAGAAVIREAASCLRSWVGVVLIADGPAGDQLDRVADHFPTHAGLLKVTAYDEWRSGINGLAHRMRRRYLDEHPAYPPPGRPTRRPRLWDSIPPSREGDDGRTE
ncbi:TIR-like protein FxsC [Actinoplanes sp. NPDC000266]